jgi:hypothetical protein
MLARTRQNQSERKGIVLVLVLGILALMALIGVTFATFSGQSRVSARNFAQSVVQPQRDELMDFALAQLISDTPLRKSAIRGHSLARDMYGNDSSFGSGFLAVRPDGAYAPPNNDPYFYIVGIASLGGTLYSLSANFTQDDPAFYGYDFTRWNMRVSYQAVGVPGFVDQTLEILNDSGFNPSSNSARTFTVNIGLTEGNSVAAVPPSNPGTPATHLINATQGTVTGPAVTSLPGQALIAATGTPRFVLDGRWLHAFNGPGMTNNAVHANFKFNQPFVAGPNAVGMDEDYDAVDLENWFLAMQSADGQVMIPSFHRPSAIRIDATVTPPVYDWGGPQNFAYENLAAGNWADSASRILRPRAADGHDAATFPDLVPDGTGKITYDVDNDGDGLTDSVWLDLGYPARRNAKGQLFKPLFSFMVIGLNGRIPLNTAGNLAGRAAGIPVPLAPPPPTYTYGGGPFHAQHLGNSVSEIDPTYALQNAFDPTYDILGAFNFPPASTAVNTQVDNSGIDVRVSQLRSLLAGIRPPQKTTFGSGVEGDTNFVSYESAAGSGTGAPLYMPNGVADPIDTAFATDPKGAPVVLALTPAVPGRWGEADSIPGGILDPAAPSPPAISNYVNLIHANYNNSIRAGYSYDVSDILATLADGTVVPRDAADDNFNAFDPFPLGHIGEDNDSDSYDAAGALILPIDRMRRYVTPADINGTGHVGPWTQTAVGAGAGADPFGRVAFRSYYRPPGSPGSITSSFVPGPPPIHGAIYYPSTANTYFYTNGPNNNTNTPALVHPSFLPDVTNNPLHAFEFFRLPPITSGGTITGHMITGAFTFQFLGGNRDGGAMPIRPLPATGPPFTNVEAHNFPIAYPTYDFQVNSLQHTDGLNEADEMNLYTPNSQADREFGFGDLEWLYRQQDVDGNSLTSRLAQLAPVSFRNPLDGQRRRRLFALDAWEMNNFAWPTDNPGNAFPTNSRFVPTANPDFATLNVAAFTNPIVMLPPYTPPVLPAVSYNATPAAPAPTAPLSHRDKKINLNYPLPVSNDPNEPIRQKWVSDAYQLLKAVLPPKAVDTPEELAQLSQFLVNVIDFRDPDCTMTHFRNPDVKLVLGSIALGPPVVYNPNYLAFIKTPILASNTAIPLDQYGMEYNPVAINEAMAYSFAINTGGATQSNRFFVELVNTLSQTAIGLLPAGAFGAGITNPPDVSTLDLSLANYDLVLTADDPVSRPDPFTGQLLPIPTANYFAQMPLNQATTTVPANPNPLFTPPLTVPPSGDVQLTPLFSVGAPSNPPAAADFPTAPNPYNFVIGSPLIAGTETTPITPTATLSPNFDPLSTTAPPTPVPANVIPPGYVANLYSVPVPPAAPQLVTTKANALPPKIAPPLVPPLAVASGTMQYYWVCLRRPANPFAPPQPDIHATDATTGLSTYNPMVVVDAMRFPYTEGGGTAANPPSLTNAKTIFSAQRCQPFRGGHAVRLPSDTTAAAAPLYTPYGYSEQSVAPTTSSTVGKYGTNPVTQPIFHTLAPGAVNDGSEPWDYFPFNDRDFTSVAELMLVPGCPPGLFTKQFAELAPMPPATTPLAIPPTTFPVPSKMPANPTASPPAAVASPFTYPAKPTSPDAAIAFPAAATGAAVQPHTYPYLVDKFFYTGYGGVAPVPPATGLTPDPGGVVDGFGSDGWFKMFEFFEVPSQMIGAIGPVAQGTDFDWARQDMKPGLLNLNLIIDEEVFFSILGSQALTMLNGAAGGNLDSFSQLLLNFTQLPPGSADIPRVVTSSLVNGHAATSTAVWGFGGSQSGLITNDAVTHGGGAFNGMKAAFAQFLTMRHALDPVTGFPVVFSNNAERPFHSLSYPDIDYTVMRPATLPPAAVTLPPTPYPGAPPYTYSADPGIRNPFIYPWGPVSIGPTGAANPVFAGGTAFSGGAGTNVALPSPIPARRLFQIPDAYGTTYNAVPVVPPTVQQSNASDSGDPFINITLTTGALATIGAGPYYINNGYPVLFWSGNAPGIPGINPYLGANSGANPDTSQHPYWRSEMMQKVMNLTTVRTHQYAVWITIGFFEVKREGDPSQILNGAPLLAYDVLGPELGAAEGQTTRYRAFFIVDRLKLGSFDDTTVGAFRPAVLYRQNIE